MAVKETNADSQKEGTGVLCILLRIALGLVLLVAGASVGLLYGNIQLAKERKANQEKLNDINKKLSLLQKKSSEERELRSGLEGQKRGLAGEVAKLRKENSALLDDMKKAENQAETLESKVKELSEENVRVKAAHDEAKLPARPGRTNR